MPRRLKARTDILPAAQQEIWSGLAPAASLSFVLYGGTAVALHLGHRVSIDFDFFSDAPLDRHRIEKAFAFMRNASTLQEGPNTLVVNATTPSGAVKVSFFGSIGIGRINDPVQTDDTTLFVASLEDLLATNLKTILQRAEAKDYRDISAMLTARVSLPRALAAFAKMYGNDPAHALKAIGFLEDGDLTSLAQNDRDILKAARDGVKDIPPITLAKGLLARRDA
jgi:hypothetical protein